MNSNSETTAIWFNDGHLGLVTSAAELAPVVRRFLGRDSREQAG